MASHMDWEELRNSLEVELGKVSIAPKDTLHLVANSLTSAIRGGRLPYHTEHIDGKLIGYINTLAIGATLAITAAKAG